MDKLEQVFHGALQVEPGAAREAYLETACGTDDWLRKRVQALLTADTGAGGFLDAPPSEAVETVATTDSANARDIEKQIGPYRILQELGEGGFGIVYMAEQEQPVRRQVALKVIKLGMDTRRVIARFEAERQALALMDHPNIARVLDAGATASGRPYFVMELVRGVPITEYCEKHKLNLRARLDLILQACHATHHAHQKGIIHRDLKPSNVLVTLADARPSPKIIDFGISKATSQRLTDKTLFTEFRQFIGTPEYMSPDQAEVGGLDVDTRTDVYSLGVMLYELLTGGTPFSGANLRKAGLEEIRRMLREVDPPRPSAVVLTKEADGLPRIGLDAAGLARRLRGDLDWIIMKALEKDRTRRYQAAIDLARDIERHLAHQPVSAGPPSFRYRTTKFIRRNRAAVAGIVTAASVLIGGLAMAIYGMVQARQAEHALRGERDAAQRAQKEAEEARSAALVQRRGAEAAVSFLRDMLASVDPSRARGREVTVRYVLDEAARQIGAGALAEQPAVEANMRTTLAASYEALGRYRAAETQLRAALATYTDELGAQATETLRTTASLSGVLNRKLQHLEAERLLTGVLDGLATALGADHADTLTARNHLGSALAGQRRWAEAEAAVADTLEARRRTLGPEHRDTLRSRALLAAVYQGLGRFDEAERELVDTLQVATRVLGDEHPDVTTMMRQLARAYESRQQHADAERLYRQSWAMADRVLGIAHPESQVLLNELLRVLRVQGKLDDMRPLMTARLKWMKREAYAAEASAMMLNNLAIELLTCVPEDLRDPAGALEASQRCVERDGERDADFLETLSQAFEANDDLTQAIEVQRQALNLARAGGPYNPQKMERRLVTLLLAAGRVVEAASFGLGDVAAELGTSFTRDFASVGGTLITQADALMARGQLSAAEDMLKACLALRQKELPEGNWAIADTESRIGEVLTRQGRLAEAGPLLEQSHATLIHNARAPRTVVDAARQRLETFQRRRAEQR